jgi:hypothetical protein
MSSLKRHMPILTNPRWPSSMSPLRRALAAVATYLVILGVAHVLAALTGITEWLILTAVLGFSVVMAVMVPEIRRLRRETAARRNANEGAGLRE